jgi:uncharacterized protein
LSKAGLIRLWLSILVLGGGCEAIAAPGETATAPSERCASVRGSAARAICSDPKLSRLNREMRGLYRKALLVGDRRSLITEQGTWIVERNRACAKKQPAELGACVAESLHARILELSNVSEPAAEKLAAASPPSPPGLVAKPKADCANAIELIDRTICNDARLAHWEDTLGKWYRQALDDPSFRTVLSDDQQRWVGERTGRCGALSSTQLTDCLLQMTKRRIEQLVQFIHSRDDPQDRASKVKEILSGKTTPPPGLDADTIDRESVRADQSELILADARKCIRRNVGVVGSLEASDAKQVGDLILAACFADFSTRMSALELGALAKPSFEMLVRQELSASK